MDIRELSIPDAYVATPRQHTDDRGVFLEWFKDETFADTVGHRLDLKQANISVSSRGTLRGIHFADVPPGQAKYVTCVSGSVLDVVVDIRVGSATFGQWESVTLDDTARRAVYVAEGLGHVFMALSDGAVVSYLCSEGYSPTREHGLHPLDPDIAIDWPSGVEPLLSPKDETAPFLRQAQEQGLLPTYAECRRFYDQLGSS